MRLNIDKGGRPEIPEEQFRQWLQEMEPFLKQGSSLYRAMAIACLLPHKDSIYRKMRLNDWFCEKISAFQSYPGEIVNSIFARIIMDIHQKVLQGQPLTSGDCKNLRWFAEKHRSCQPFFITRHEVAKANPNKISKILDKLEEAAA